MFLSFPEQLYLCVCSSSGFPRLFEFSITGYQCWTLSQRVYPKRTSALLTYHRHSARKASSAGEGSEAEGIPLPDSGPLLRVFAIAVIEIEVEVGVVDLVVTE